MVFEAVVAFAEVGVVDQQRAAADAGEIRACSRQRFGMERADIEMAIAARLGSADHETPRRASAPRGQAMKASDRASGQVESASPYPADLALGDNGSLTQVTHSLAVPAAEKDLWLSVERPSGRLPWEVKDPALALGVRGPNMDSVVVRSSRLGLTCGDALFRRGCPQVKPVQATRGYRFQRGRCLRFAG